MLSIFTFEDLRLVIMLIVVGYLVSIGADPGSPGSPGNV